MKNQVAQTILEQLGGNKFLAMTGAKNLISASDSLSFMIPKNQAKANRVVITLMPNDLYRMEFWKVNVKLGIVEVLDSVEGLDFEQLPELFSTTTGFVLAL